jgi:phosphoglycolate phosphatase-like HAD superfamily hydrolase
LEAALLAAEGGEATFKKFERLLTESRDAGLRLAIATTTTPANVTALLESVLPEKLDWFEVIGAGDVVPAKKPTPDICHYVLKTSCGSSASRLRIRNWGCALAWGWP